ncbi:branched-chain amino acid transport system II carrier protein [Parasphingorhabdus pacifica]
MTAKLNPLQLLAIGLMLLAMFLGAGNTIFAPMVGQQAGIRTWIPMTGFLLAGVGLVFLAIVALARAGGRVEVLTDRVHPRFTSIFGALLFLTLGPLYVIPRTVSVVYEISIRPSLEIPDESGRWVLFGFSVVFTLLSVFLSLNPGKFVDRMGKLITPVFSVFLAVIVIKSVITPMSEPQNAVAPYTEGALLKGFTEGYFTMDALAAFVFGGVFIQSIKAIGVRGNRELSRVFIKAGVITAIGLSVLHISLAWIGATSVGAIGYRDNGGVVLAESAHHLLGYAGVLMIGTVIFLTGVTTNVACLSSSAEYFSRAAPRISYRNWVFTFAGIGILITNFGLNTILELAAPILSLLYPLAITLILLSLLNTYFHGYRSVYVGAMIGAGVVAVFDAIKAADIYVDEINSALAFVPLFSDGGGWVLPALIGAVAGFGVGTFRKDAAQQFESEDAVATS